MKKSRERKHILLETIIALFNMPLMAILALHKMPLTYNTIGDYSHSA